MAKCNSEDDFCIFMRGLGVMRCDYLLRLPFKSRLVGSWQVHKYV